MSMRDYQDGGEHGERWARVQRNRPKAVRLDELMDYLLFRTGNGFEIYNFFHDGEELETVAAKVYFALAPQHDGDRERASQFWAEFGFDDDFPGSDFVRGFVDGATHVVQGQRIANRAERIPMQSV